MMDENEMIKANAPKGATHWDTGENCYLKAENDCLYYMPIYLTYWQVSAHKDGVDALEIHSYCVPLSELN